MIIKNSSFSAYAGTVFGFNVTDNTQQALLTGLPFGDNFSTDPLGALPAGQVNKIVSILAGVSSEDATHAKMISDFQVQLARLVDQANSLSPAMNNWPNNTSASNDQAFRAASDAIKQAMRQFLNAYGAGGYAGPVASTTPTATSNPLSSSKLPLVIGGGALAVGAVLLLARRKVK